MTQPQQVSQVVAFRAQQMLEEQAARQGVSGLAVVATHESITARAQRGADRILQLIQEGNHAEAQRLMELKTWGVDEAVCPKEPEPRDYCINY